MDDVIFRFIEEKSFEDAVLIVGLPGIGSVALLAADQLISELGAKKIADIYSMHLPARVFVDDNGFVKLINNEIYCYEKEGFGVLILTGTSQAQSQEGQYIMAQSIIEKAKEMGVKQIITMGGYAVSKMVEDPRVIGAATSQELINEYGRYDVYFGKGEPGGGIVGASGLLLGIGKLNEVDGICLMGETSGYIPDPIAAKKVLQVISEALSLDIKYFALDEKAKQIELIEGQLRENMQKIDSDETLRYIG